MGRFDEKFDKDTKDAVARAVIDGLDGKGNGASVPDVLHALSQGTLTGTPNNMSESYARDLAKRERRLRSQLPESKWQRWPEQDAEPATDDGHKELSDHAAWMLDVHQQDVRGGRWQAEWGKNASDSGSDARDTRGTAPALALAAPSFGGHSTNVLFRSALNAGLLEPMRVVERD
jgi:hypothetical protein